MSLLLYLSLPRTEILGLRYKPVICSFNSTVPHHPALPLFTVFCNRERDSHFYCYPFSYPIGLFSVDRVDRFRIINARLITVEEKIYAYPSPWKGRIDTVGIPKESVSRQINARDKCDRGYAAIVRLTC